MQFFQFETLKSCFFKFLILEVRFQHIGIFQRFSLVQEKVKKIAFLSIFEECKLVFVTQNIYTKYTNYDTMNTIAKTFGTRIIPHHELPSDKSVCLKFLSTSNRQMYVFTESQSSFRQLHQHVTLTIQMHSYEKALSFTPLQDSHKKKFSISLQGPKFLKFLHSRSRVQNVSSIVSFTSKLKALLQLLS